METLENMLCSDCKKNTAVIFIEEKNKDGKKEKKGYCYNCAKKRGITTLSNTDNGNINNISNENLANISNQLNNMIKDLTENLEANGGLSQEELEEMASNVDGMNLNGVNSNWLTF
jgi:protein-arginine kinase activator protein McsA